MSAFFYLLPALLLLATLLLGRYPGERLLLAVARRRPPDRPAAEPPALLLPIDRPRLPRGGALLGAALAGRAPPPRSRGAAPRARRTRTSKAKKGFEMKAKILVPAALLALALLAPAAAQAHVTLQPSEAPAGAYTVLDVRVPNETDNANTTKVAVQFPAGFGSVSYQPVPGWSVKVVNAKLPEPIETDDGPMTEGVREVVFSGGKVAPGEFQDFPLSLQIPGKAGEELTFKAVQTYDDGEVVHWIGGPESDHPAPQVLVTAAEADHHGGGGAGGEEDEARAETTATAASGSGDSGGDSGDGASKGLGIAALVVGALGLLAGGTALVVSRRRPA